MPAKKASGGKAAKEHIGEIRESIMEKCGELFDANVANIMRILEESEDRKVAVNFNTMIDASESKALLSVRIAYSEKFTDERVEEFESEDPNEPFLPGIKPIELKKEAKAKAKAKGDKKPKDESAPPEGKMAAANDRPD